MFKIGNAAPTIIINTDIIIFKIVFHLYMLVKLEASEIIVNKKALVIRERKVKIFTFLDIVIKALLNFRML